VLAQAGERNGLTSSTDTGTQAMRALFIARPRSEE
jgi:hypothetical protein